MYLKSQNSFLAAVYLRLSKDDGDKMESDSIRNQRSLIRDFAKQHSDITLVKEYVDDGFSGTNFERPDFQKMMEDARNHKINCIIVKDLSRLGRNYIETGRYLEKIFPVLGIRFIAVNDHYDSADTTNDSDQIIVPFKNLVNDAYCRDISIKIRSQLDIKRKKGQFIGNYAGYGYFKDPEDKNRCDMSKPYEWAGVSVVRMLEKPEYMGDTVNFRTKKLSYKDKVAVKNDSDEIVVFTDTHEAIIDRKTWYMVQELRKTKRRINTEGESNPFVGKIFCADCGGKMHYHNEGKRAGRKWRGLPDGSVRTTPACYNCGNYNNSHDQSGKVCCSHNIQAKVIDQFVLETIQYACKSVRMDERAFVESIRTNICKLSDRHKK